MVPLEHIYRTREHLLLYINTVKEEQLAYLAAAHSSLVLGGCSSVPRDARDHQAAGVGGRGYVCYSRLTVGCPPVSQ